MRPEIKKTNTKLCLADGGVINTMGYIDLPIQVGNFTTVQKFTVADIDVPAVIGYDYCFIICSWLVILANLIGT
jgi:hypothetical protein